MIPEIINSESEALAQKQFIREGIIVFEKQLSEQEGVFFGDSDICPLKHTFSDGIYVREIFIPAGSYLVGKIHKHSHPNFLLSGTVDVVTEGNGKETLTGPLSMISSPGTKRALYAVTDIRWVTIHENPTNTQDLSKLEKIVIADSYEEYEKFIESKNDNKFIGFMKRIFKIGGSK